jgi:hypothetical protein
VKTGGARDLVYTIARNRAHLSVEFIFSEGVELEPAEDSLQIISGIVTSRPNFFLTVDEANLDAFVSDWKALEAGDGSWGAFAAKYGARRSDPAFWSTFDFFTDAFPALDPIGAADSRLVALLERLTRTLGSAIERRDGERRWGFSRRFRLGENDVQLEDVAISVVLEADRDALEVYFLVFREHLEELLLQLRQVIEAPRGAPVLARDDDGKSIFRHRSGRRRGFTEVVEESHRDHPA